MRIVYENEVYFWTVLEAPVWTVNAETWVRAALQLGQPFTVSRGEGLIELKPRPELYPSTQSVVVPGRVLTTKARESKLGRRRVVDDRRSHTTSNAEATAPPLDVERGPTVGLPKAAMAPLGIAKKGGIAERHVADIWRDGIHWQWICECGTGGEATSYTAARSAHRRHL